MTAPIGTDVAALALGVTDRTVRRWVADGTLTNHGSSRRILVDLTECARVGSGKHPMSATVCPSGGVGREASP